MKRLLLALLFTGSALNLLAQPLLVGTYNVRNQNGGDTYYGNGWERRCPVICAQMNFEEPDIFGTQEARIGQLRDMRSQLDGYDFIGVGRDDGKEGGEFAAIFYRTDRLRLLSHGDFWISQTPDSVSFGWDAACRRVCTWGEFRDKATRRKFFFFNLHLDHIGTQARREGARLVVSKIRDIARGCPVVLTGDFNVDQTDEIYTIFTQSGLLKDSYVVARNRFAENGTFNSFGADLKTTSRIDHVFVSPAFDVRAYGVLTDSYWTDDVASETIKGNDAPLELGLRHQTRRNPSDHYPVLVRLQLSR